MTYIQPGDVIWFESICHIDDLETSQLQSDVEYESVKLDISILCITSTLTVNNKHCYLKYKQ